MDKVIDKIAFEEGFEPLVYLCPTGFQTVGYGFNLEAMPMPKQVADLWLSLILKDIGSTLSKYQWFRDLDENRRVVIYDMAYQLGISGLLKFKKMIAAIETKNWLLASNELMNSKYAKQTPNRANRNSSILRSGEL